ncbi:MAG: 7-cyano-7-deazaguanine synthase QueC [Elusimicrobia bacterium]|nr:7-cyano-7-deazaguanine synthase QueC [Elusimicrobiota bacterium]
MKKAVVLLSGGLDSAACLYWAKARGWRVVALSVRYGQRHARELRSARSLARRAGAELFVVRLRLSWLAASSLCDPGRKLPDVPLSKIGRGPIPSTYVPGRNMVFTALGLSLADAVGAQAVVLGANALDSSGYPDCRPEFFKAFARAAKLGTRGRIAVLAPLAKMDKAGIVRLALRLGVPLDLTWSCYKGGRKPCGRCDSCKLRAKGFKKAGAEDPLA